MIQTVLLAAGASQRFGSNKLLHALPSGNLLIEQSLDNLCSVAEHVLVVVHPDNEELIAWLGSRKNIVVLECDSSRHSMGSSISAAIRFSRNADAWLLVLADMPYLRKDTIQSILKLLDQGAPLAAPTFNNQQGHPVGFNKQFEEQLIFLSQDRGAREILLKYQDQLVLSPCSDPGVLKDIDYKEDIEANIDWQPTNQDPV